MASVNESDEHFSMICDHVGAHAFVECKLNHEKTEKDEKHKGVRGTNVTMSQEDRSVRYQLCTKHSKSESYLNHFCKHHACLVCLKCARKVHAECLVVPVKVVCREINRIDIEDFGRVVMRKKLDLLSTKENLETTLLQHLADQYDAVFNECQVMFNEQEAKLKCLKMHFEAEIEEVFNTQSQIISNQVADIDTIVANLDEVYRDIQTIENEYKHEDENLFIRIQDSVVKINLFLENFRRIENSIETVSLKFHPNEGLDKFITRVNSLGTLKKRIKSLEPVLCVDDVVFPPNSRGPITNKTRKSKYGTWRSLKFK